MSNEILASLVGAAGGAAGLWLVQFTLGKKARGESRHEGVQAKLHDHEVRISILEIKGGFRGIPRRR